MQGLVIYKSSAGSGKTFTLVKEYIRLLVNNPAAFRHILAITFTNKATGEMKNRIVEALVSLSRGENPLLEKILMEESEGKITPSLLKEKSALALQNILHDYSRFSVNTIDSFFQKLLRSLAYELRLPIKFEVEMNLDHVTETVADHVLQEAGKNPELTRWLEKLILSRMEEDRGWNLEKDLQSVAAELLRERAQGSTASLTPQELETFTDSLWAIRRSFEAQMKQWGEKGRQFIQAAGLSPEDFSYGKRGVAQFFCKISSASPQPADFMPSKTIPEYAEYPEKWSSKSSPLKEKIVALAGEKLAPLLKEILDYINSHGPAYQSAVSALKLIHLYGVSSYLNEQFRNYRDENNVMLISDASPLLSKFISGDDTPFLFEKTGNQYKYYLIDEFQDTSDKQWSVILPLVINALSEGSYSMIVGDAKQSIYRWRGGNMRLLLDGIHRHLSPFRSMMREVMLDTNYRSGKNIIQFNNLFFPVAGALLKELVEKNYTELFELAYHEQKVEQKVSKGKEDNGYVQIRFLKEENASAYKEQALGLTLETLRSLEKEGYSGSDICLLVRSNTEGSRIAGFLMENGFPHVVSPESLFLQNSRTVRFLISLFQTIHQPRDPVARIQTLNHYLSHFGGELKGELDAGMLHRIFSDSPHAGNSLFKKELPASFTTNLDYFSRLPLYELTEQLIQCFHLNSKPDGYLQRFQDLVLEFAGNHPPGIGNFLEWWDKNKNTERCALNTPESTDAVTVMTIHKSKGLQFPVVIMPFTDWKLTPDFRDVLWVRSEKEPFAKLPALPVRPGEKLSSTFFAGDYHTEIVQSYLDNLNLLYVAFTRAEEALYIFTPEREAGKTTTISELLNRSLEEKELNKFRNTAAGIFEMGIRGPRHRSRASSSSPDYLTLYPSERWQSRLTIRPASQDLPWSGNGRLFGRLVHRILEKIIHPGQLDSVLGQALMDGIIGQKEKGELKSLLAGILKMPQVRQWFSDDWKALAEKEVILPSGEILRPDRVLTRENEAIVIDYKTGDAKKEHTSQVNRYARVLGEMGYKKVNCFLLYTDTREIVDVHGENSEQPQ